MHGDSRHERLIGYGIRRAADFGAAARPRRARCVFALAHTASPWRRGRRGDYSVNWNSTRLVSVTRVEASRISNDTRWPDAS